MALASISEKSGNMKLSHTPKIVKLESIKQVTPRVKIFSFYQEEIAKRAKPGQFLMIWIPGIDEIPMSVANVEKNGLVTIAVAAVGDATRALHKKQEGDVIGVRGPYGNHFDIRKYSRILIVAGGYGVAPLSFAAKVAYENHKKITFIYGAKCKEELFFREKIEKYSEKVVYTTEDGSLGIKGLVTDAFDYIDDISSFDTCLICGPENMIKAVWDICKKEKIKVQASLERYMMCGFGICGSCALGPYLVCKDGPVFSTRRLRIIEKFW